MHCNVKIIFVLFTISVLNASGVNMCPKELCSKSVYHQSKDVILSQIDSFMVPPGSPIKVHFKKPPLHNEYLF